MTTEATKAHREFLREYLRDPEAAVAFLIAALEEGEEVFGVAVGEVEEAQPQSRWDDAGSHVNCLPQQDGAMAINADKSDRWKADVERSVDYYNDWFVEFTPKTYRQKRVEVTHDVEAAMVITRDLREIMPEVFRENPRIQPMLRMATCPLLAKDRIVGLAYASL